MEQQIVLLAIAAVVGIIGKITFDWLSRKENTPRADEGFVTLGMLKGHCDSEQDDCKIKSEMVEKGLILRMEQYKLTVDKRLETGEKLFEKFDASLSRHNLLLDRLERRLDRILPGEKNDTEPYNFTS